MNPRLARLRAILDQMATPAEFPTVEELDAALAEIMGMSEEDRAALLASLASDLWPPR